MSDLVVGLGIALIAEGLLWALAPHTAIKALELAATAPPGQLRAIAWGAVTAGLFMVWMIRG